MKKDSGDSVKTSILKYIFRKMLRQGYTHQLNLIEIQVLLRRTLEEEFTEDNAPTLKAFSTECYEAAWRYPTIKPGSGEEGAAIVDD